jgi:hypothetical protein
MIRDYFSDQEKQWEKLCLRCGGCCGAFDDPCKHLKKGKNTAYYCEIYPKRLGLRETLAGEKFNCVSICEIIETSWKKDWMCAYKNRLSKPFVK